MNLIKVAAGVVNQTPLAWEGNKRNIIDCIEEAKNQEISILCLPELCITGYGCEDMFYATSTCETALEILQDIVEVTSGIIVSVGLPIRINNRVYNVACLIANKQIRGFACKKNLANNGLHYETRWFQPWPDNQRTELTIGEFSYPVGDLIFDAGGIKIGFEICEDAWIANRPGRSLYLQGVDIILNPTASHFAFFKTQTRERLVQDGSRAFGVAYIYANLLGNEAGRAIFDGDAMIAQAGEMLVSGTRFSYRDFYLTPAVIDIDKVRLEQVQNRLTFSGTSQKVPFLYDFPPIKPIKQRFELEHWEAKGFQKEEEFARAIALALFDYLRKSRSSGWVISLSGGADSSAITGLCYLAIELGVAELGLEGFKQKLGYIKKIQDCQSVQELSKALITNIYQGTENSSDDTRYSASSLAESLNTTFYHININGLVETYKDLIQGAIGRNLSWETDDLALQNIQARVRAPSAWLLANINNALLLATSNRSEAAVGYATMDGDTSGSISPIAGIDKHFLRHWLRWLENTGLDGQLRLSGLKAMNNLQPTAELRPLEAKQIDEEDLMPYDLLNAIETAAFRDKKSPKDCLELMELEFEDIYSREKLVISIERFFRLWSRNQWKRERYAPSFHVDDHNLDPRSWLRFPILSGGFDKELADMHDYANDSKGKQRKGRIGF
ncbi:NAD(+) synthase [Flectobacillus longus]|uniref:NAD(+) synthase n=1 Tax=Flectobacillus longus TaxID=2984207 RepID=UPI0024B7E1CF|nr:NAD(+) synthase [Flectobacillus longus]MDI9878432.1 NAD(+) synthase [Flectobacillus longus]